MLAILSYIIEPQFFALSVRLMKEYLLLSVRLLVIKECYDMDLKQELTDHEIGGIGDIKNTPSGSTHIEWEQRVVS